ncbi:MAG: 7-cyano-7-deazaguanine synthase [Nanoarchaeota archaeon]|nr:7-cyano-7-deazaguanine synthase [Nanoarchaeota archaeon]MCG2717445.1 7-cyano-7-deazaguanine synthase [Nanoarchaeota archaeon]
MAKMKLVTLLSGGIDSPVAAWNMINLDCKVILVHFHNFTSTSKEVKDKIIEITKVLSKHQPKLKLYLIPFKEIQKELVKFIPSKYRMIITRRMMLRIASKILEKEKYEALVTGDNLAQVASQTLENINAIYKVTKHPILTPLLGENKDDIVNKAKEIGTYELSILPYSDCCSLLVGKHPETRARLEDVEAIEKNMDVKKLTENALKNSDIKII